MYEDYYGFTEKPFSLTPDPKYLYKSESHANAFDLLQYAIRRREGFVVVTGDIGTGKTTLCRAILGQLDRKTFTALVLNPFLSEDDLLRLILQDFGVVSREELKRGRLAGISKQELIETLNDFLLSLLPLRARAVLIIDEAQNLPLPVLEQIRILSNLETEKEKLLQIVLVGQLNLQAVLRSPEMRQLDQRVSIRYELRPLTCEETAAYVAHRLTIAGGSAAVSFSPRALETVHRYTSGIPRLINLLCDRSLLGAFSARGSRIQPEMVRQAAANLDLHAPPFRLVGWLRRRVAAAVLALTAAGALGLSAAGYAYHQTAAARTWPPPPPAELPRAPAFVPPHPPPGGPVGVAVRPPGSAPAAGGRAGYAVLVGSFRRPAEASTLVGELEALGYQASRRGIDLGERGFWYQVLVGRYRELEEARQAEARLRQLPGYGDAMLIRPGGLASP